MRRPQPYSSLQPEGAHLRLADVACHVTLHAAPFDGAGAVPQCKIATTLAVQRYGLTTLHIAQVTLSTDKVTENHVPA